MPTPAAKDSSPASPYLVTLRETTRKSGRPIAQFGAGEFAIEIRRSPEPMLRSTCMANPILVRLKRQKLPMCTVTTAGGDVPRPDASSDDRIDYRVPACLRPPHPHLGVISWCNSPMS